MNENHPLRSVRPSLRQPFQRSQLLDYLTFLALVLIFRLLIFPGLQ